MVTTHSTHCDKLWL